MKICLTNFQNSGNVTYEFPDTAHISLIKGDSGCGKTTIFDAIYWALFAVGNDVVSYHHPKTTTSVEFVTNSLTVKRVRRPATSTRELFVTKGDEKFEGDTAQGVIVREYGNADIWFNSCYIGGDLYHILMDGTQKEKVHFLHSLVYSNDDPECYLEHAKTSLASHMESFKIAEGVRNKYDLQEIIDVHPDPDTRIKELYKELESIQVYNTARVRKESTSISADKNEWAEFARRVSTMKTWVEPIDAPLLTPEEFSELDYAWKKYDKYVALLGKYRLPVSIDKTSLDHLHQNVDDIVDEYTLFKKKEELLKKYPDIPTNTDPLSIEKHAREYKNYLEIKRVCGTIGIPVDESVSHVQRLIDTAPSRQKIKRLRLAGQVSDIPDIESKISGGSQRVLACPWCNKSVQASKGNLVKSTSKPQDSIPEAEFEKLKSNLAQLQELKILLEQDIPSCDISSTTLSSHLSILKMPYVTTKPEYTAGDVELMQRAHRSNIESLFAGSAPIRESQKRYGKIKEPIEYVDMPALDIKLCSQRRAYEDLMWIVASIPSRPIECHSEAMECMKQGKSQAIAFANKMVLRINEHEKNTRDLDQLKVPERPDSDVRDEIDRMTTHQLYLRQKSLLDSANEDLNKKQEEVKIASDYYKLLVDKESWVIRTALSSVNAVLEAVCGEIFDEPIMVSIESFKTLADGKSSRANVNIKIVYNGVLYKSYKKLSTGQTNRLTLALSIAFSQLVPSRLVLFDEILNRVSEEQRVCAVECMRKYLVNKQVLYIGHKDTEHVFDHILKLS